MAKKGKKTFTDVQAFVAEMVGIASNPHGVVLDALREAVRVAAKARKHYLPSAKLLATKCGMGVATVNRLCEELVNEGKAIRVPGPYPRYVPNEPEFLGE